MRPLLHLDIAAMTHAGPQALADRQQARWARLLGVAARGSSHFRAVLDGRDPATVTLAEVPPSHKSELMRDFSGWVTDSEVELSALEAWTADPLQVGRPWLDRYIVWESSGSTGEPTMFVQDAQALAVYDALESMRRSPARPLQRMLDPFYLADRVAFVGVIDGHFAGEVSMRRLRREQPWRAANWRSFSILQSAAALSAQLNEFQPTILATYPTAAAMLARTPGLTIGLSEVWTGGETLTPATRTCIEERFGCGIRNSYGASEFLPIAWECAHHQLHVNADWVVLEPVDSHGRPVPAGTLSHTTLLTNLANHVQPIIRLDIGDAIRLTGARCECGCTLPVVEVEGRSDDVLILDGRDGQSIAVLPLALATVLEDEAEVTDFQLVQQGPRSVRLRLGPRVDRGADTRCRQALERFARQLGLAPLRLQVRHEAALPSERSGKRRRIVSKPVRQTA